MTQRDSSVRALNLIKDVPAPDRAVVSQAAREAGFDYTNTSLRAEQEAAAELKRARDLVNRDQPFSTRLTRRTKAGIYAIANKRNVPIAQVIEEMLEAYTENTRTSATTPATKASQDDPTSST